MRWREERRKEEIGERIDSLPQPRHPTASTSTTPPAQTPGMAPNPLLANPTFSDTPFFFDRNADRGSYSGASGGELEGESWRGGAQGNGAGVGVSPSVGRAAGRAWWLREGGRGERWRDRGQLS